MSIINCGGAQTFNILHSTSPGNKLKALQILSAVLVEVIPQNIESDETFCLLYTPETILNRLFFIYTNLDCFIATSTASTQSNDSGVHCSSDFSSRCLLEISTVFQNLLSSTLWAPCVISLLCKEMKAILPFRENGDKTPLDLNILVSKNGIFDIWRALSVLTLLNVTSYKTRVGSVVKILSKDKDSKLPNNRRGRIVQMDEQTNSASVVLADGEIVEGMALDQLDLEYEESVISEAIDSSVLKVLFDNVALLLPLDLPSSTIVEATLRYRLMAYVCSIINNVSSESSEIPVSHLCSSNV